MRKGVKVLVAVALTATSMAVGGASAKATVVPGFAEQTMLATLTAPTDMAFAPDGRVFVSEKSGIVKVFPNISTDTPTVVADLRTQVFNSGDRGLLSLALDPQFPTRPYLYLAYTFDAPVGGTAPTWGAPGVNSDICPDPPGLNTLGCVVSSRLTRITLSGNAMVGQEQVLVNDWCQQFGSHSIGQIRFGPDGALYLSGGEGASYTFADYGQTGQPVNPCGDPPAGVGGAETIPTSEGGSLRAQDLRTSGDPTSLDGSVIRVDPDTGNPLPDNPLYAQGPDKNAQRIIAHGFRNPFRMTFEPGTKTLYVGDVGLSTTEEINQIPTPPSAVKNFGWPCYEGPDQLGTFSSTNLCQNLYADPGGVTQSTFRYKHGQALNANDTCSFASGSATSGLAFSTGTVYPSQYQNALFMADYARNCIWVVFRGAGGQLDWTTLRTFSDTASRPVDLEIGPDGFLYYVAISGSIRRFSYSQQAPTAVVTASVTSGAAPLPVHFDGTQSTDAETPTQLSYSWDLNGDGVFGDATGSTADFTFTANGAYTVKLRVTDPTGLSSTASVNIAVGDSPPVPVVDTPTVGATYKVGDLISFHGSATDAEDGVEPAANLSWTAVLNHCPTVGNCHQHFLGQWDGVNNASFNAPDHDYPSSIDISLTATDQLGVTTTVVRHLSPLTTTLVVDTSPAPLSVNVNTDTVSGRTSKTVVQGETVSIGAPSPQASNGGSATFTSWSDGGAAFHNVVVPDANSLSVIANYSTSGIPLISVGDVSAPEGNSGISNIAFPITLAQASTTPITVKYQTSSGTAIAGADFWPIAPTTLTFNPGQTTKFVIVGLKPNTLYEADKTFSLQLSSPTNALIARSTATGTIVNDDPAPQVNVGDASVVEGNTGKVFALVPVTLSTISALPVTFTWAANTGTATGADFWIPSSPISVTIPARWTTGKIAVGIKPNLIYQPNRQFTVTMGNIVGATPGRVTATVTIVDDDPMPTISVADVSRLEGNAPPSTFRFAFTLSAAEGFPVTVAWQTQPGTAIAGVDFWPVAPTTVTIPAGQTSVSVSVGIRPNTIKQPNRQFTVVLSNPQNASLSRAVATGTIIDDD
jgi:glucose/arabinose dehydrogenase/PKD repeat protein